MNKKRVVIFISATIIMLLIIGIGIFATRQSAETPDRLLSLGEKYLTELNYEQALVQFLKVIEIDPMNPRGYTGAAEAYIGLGQTDDAIAILRQGLERTGDNGIQDMLDRMNAEYDEAELLNIETTESPAEELTEENQVKPFIDVPDDVRQIFEDMAAAFMQDDRQTVMSLMEHEKLYAFMRENYSNVDLSALYENNRQVIKISDVVYTYFPNSDASANVETCNAVYVGYCKNGTGKYIEAYPSKHTYDEYENWRGAQWKVFDLVNFNATGEYRRTNYSEDGFVEREEYGNVVDWKFEGIVTSVDNRSGRTPVREDAYTNGLMDGTYQDEPIYYSPFGNADKYARYIQCIHWLNI